MANSTTLQAPLYQVFFEMGMRDTYYSPNISKYSFMPGGILNGVKSGKTFNKYADILKG